MIAQEQRLSGMSEEQLRSKIESIMDSAKSTLKLLSFLQIEKFNVIGIEISKERRTPLIHIANSGKCQWLKKVHKAYNMSRSYGPYGAELTWRCDLMGCRIQWVERGN